MCGPQLYTYHYRNRHETLCVQTFVFDLRISILKIQEVEISIHQAVFNIFCALNIRFADHLQMLIISEYEGTI